MVTLDGRGSWDPEGGTLAYAWTENHAPRPGMTISGVNTATPSFTAPNSDRTYWLSFILTVTDPGGLSDRDVMWVEAAVSNPPTADAGDDFTTAEGYPVTLDGSGSSDPDGERLAYAWTQTGGAPTAALTGATTATPTFTAPQVTGNTALTFTLTVTDPGGLSATDTVTVTVNDGNAAPIADAGSDFTTAEGYSATLDGSGSSDPENGRLTYAWTQTGGTPTAALTGATTATPTFTAPQVIPIQVYNHPL